MPVAKAKGAIFAIYADSPSVQTRSSSVSASSSSTLVKPTRAATTKTVSPTKCPSVAGSAAPRRALGTLQPSAPTGRRGFPSAKPHSGKDGKDGKVFQVKMDDKVMSKSTKPLRPTALSTTAPSAAATKTAATATSKRPHGLLSPTTPAAPSTPAKQLRDRERGQGSAKRIKSAGRKGEGCEKENRPLSSDPLDSPAGRTRSKTGTGARAHRPAESISTLGDMALSSPNRPRAATTSAVPGERSERSRQEDVFGVRGLSGVVMKDGTGLMGGDKSSGKMRKGLGVRPDGPLVDVSEAYGATGEEPVGFRDAVLV